jgi:hypothetical protein
LIGQGDISAGIRLVSALPRFLRHRLTPAQARAILQERLTCRAADFQGLVHRTVFAQSGSPYRALLRHAGCEFGDLARLIERDGLEGALGELRRQGVYLTIEEFKGRRPVVRGSTRLDVEPAQLRNPLSSVYLHSHSSGSRGPRTAVGTDLAVIRDHAVDVAIFLDARRGLGWRHALWGVPGGFALDVMLRLAAGGATPVRWFSQIDPGSPELHPRYRWSARALRWTSRVAGVPLPPPEFASLEQPLNVARWMSETLSRGDVPALFTFPTSAVRLCETAADAALSLRGAKLWITGEPITTRRLGVFAAAGADVAGQYGSSEGGGPVAYGCLHPERRAELHLLSDLHALVQAGASAGRQEDLPPKALLYSSLRDTAPFVLLNVAIGDQADVEPACDCSLARAGWDRTLRGVPVRSSLSGDERARHGHALGAGGYPAALWRRADRLPDRRGRGCAGSSAYRLRVHLTRAHRPAGVKRSGAIGGGGSRTVWRWPRATPSVRSTPRPGRCRDGEDPAPSPAKDRRERSRPCSGAVAGTVIAGRPAAARHRRSSKFCASNPTARRQRGDRVVDVLLLVGRRRMPPL